MSDCCGGILLNSSTISKGRDILTEIEDKNKYLLNVNGLDNNEMKIRKNEGKLKIYFYGENLLKSLIQQTTFQDTKVVEGKIEFQKGFDQAFNWEYFIFDKITEDNNEFISYKLGQDFLNKEFYDIIVVTVNTLLDEKSVLFFKHFQNFSNQKAKQPFILYITKEEQEPKVETLFNFITNEYFDKRTIYALKYPSLINGNENKSILELICKFRNYYHEEGDSFQSFSEDIATNYKFNILVCGRAGTGKSSFINNLLGERKAKEGEGLSVTHKIVSYMLKDFPIIISDTPGFENDETVKEVKILLDKYNKKLIDARKKVNLILYFFPYSERSILNMELPILESLIEYKTEILFVMNFVTEPIEKKHFIRIKEICEESLKKLLPEKFPIRIYPINIYSKVDEEEDEENEDAPHKLKIIKAFGIDVLFKAIFSLFKSNIIDINDIKKIKSGEELFTLFKKNNLFDQFNQLNDLFISFRSELSNLILSYGRLNRLSLSKEKNMEDMANLIFLKCLGRKCNNYMEYMEQLSSKLQVEDLFDKFTESLEILKSYKKDIHTMFFYKSIHDHKTLALGYLCLNEIEKLFESSSNVFVENDKLNFDLIYNLFNSYNQAINGFIVIAQKFEKFYELENEQHKKIIDDFKNKNIKKDNNSIETEPLKENVIDVKDSNDKQD
jgi:GTP-binding protein EngB required for normal cell division